MKLFIVTCLKELLGDISKIFKLANIDIFSSGDIIGHRDGQPPGILEEWFASGNPQFDSVMIFAFTSDANTKLGIELIIDYNKKLKENFPVRAFVLPVEKYV
ncbi:hypothetical protein HGH93_08705 [Chitinophaga polysaccharea]|uniref:hypothetical protein n=1 Tax=Chitinophaga TaxID=79328 RepID=UPI001454F4EC|nr:MULTISPECIES: hypothetical protein [Chitinophaga]NLR58175.1 hypothetical protein [Chitinophaga polysaccharea]NLU90699.1 hypothetical protein [Chitinophaga sp. Ak27]